MSCPRGSFSACYECGGDELVRLRAKLAAVTKERDEARSEDRDVVYRRLLRERDALKARVAALEAALEAMELSFRFATNDAVRSAAGRVYCSKCYYAVMAGLGAKEGG